MVCEHPSFKTIRTTCYIGSVAQGDQENRAAHGGVCVHEECDACGARRKCNINQGHVEVGPWGPSREERQAAADAMKRKVLELPRLNPIEIKGTAGQPVVVNQDADGFLIFDGAVPGTEKYLAVAIPDDWMYEAKRRRKAIQELHELLVEV